MQEVSDIIGGLQTSALPTFKFGVGSPVTFFMNHRHHQHPNAITTVSKNISIAMGGIVVTMMVFVGIAVEVALGSLSR